MEVLIIYKCAQSFYYWKEVWYKIYKRKQLYLEEFAQNIL